MAWIWSVQQIDTSTAWLTYHSTTSLVNKEDLANNIRGESIGSTATDALEESSSEQTVV
jgi:hypothetical protein